MLLRELFFPRTFKEKLLFAEKVVGITVDESVVRVIFTTISKNKTTITQCEEFPINPGEPKTYNQRLTATLKKVAPQLPKKCRIRANFPSTKVIIKELTLPFLEVEKIKRVIDYEIESNIPFTLDKALVDFIVVGQSDVKESSTVLAAAAQHDDIKKFVDVFHKAGIEPEVVTVDVFSLADLFTHTEPYAALKQEVALVDVGAYSTRIILFNKQQLVATRTLTKGVIPSSENEQETHLSALFEEIQFTLNSFELKRTTPLILEKVFYAGDTTRFDAFNKFAQETLHVSCEQFLPEKIASNITIQAKTLNNSDRWHTYIHAISTALCTKQYEYFTLRQKDVALSLKETVTYHAITATTLTLLLFGSLLLSGYFEIKTLNDRIKNLQQKQLHRLREILPNDHSAKKRSALNAVIKATEEYVQDQEEVWSPFAQERLRPAEILQELCAIFNKKKYNLTIQEVLISGGDQIAHPIEVKGVFKSHTGNDHFTHFNELAQDIKNSKILSLTEEIDPTLVENGNGVEFIVHLKKREE